MRVTIDHRMCIGAGLCLAEAPEAFTLEDTPEGPRAVLRINDADAKRLMAAAVACPTLAIALEDEAGQVVFPPE